MSIIAKFLRIEALKVSSCVVFIADSDPEALTVNSDSFKELTTLLEPKDTPIIIVFNMRDLPDVLPDVYLLRGMGLTNWEKYPLFRGVFGECLGATSVLTSSILWD